MGGIINNVVLSVRNFLELLDGPDRPPTYSYARILAVLNEERIHLDATEEVYGESRLARTVLIQSNNTFET